MKHDATISRSRVQTANEVPEETANTNGNQRIDTIRDLLFGEQTAFLEERIKNLDSDLSANLEAMQNDLAKRLSSLEVLVKSEMKDVRHRIEEEAKARHRVSEELSSSIREADEKHAASNSALKKEATDSAARFEKLVEKNHASLQSEVSASIEKLQKASDKKVAALSSKISDHQKQIDGELSKRIDALESDKVGASKLASALADVASSLKSDK